MKTMPVQIIDFLCDSRLELELASTKAHNEITTGVEIPELAVSIETNLYVSMEGEGE